MKKTLYEYVILHHNKFQSSAVESTIAVTPTLVLATSEQEVRFIAARDIPKEYTAAYDKLEILVREWKIPNFTTNMFTTSTATPLYTTQTN